MEYAPKTDLDESMDVKKPSAPKPTAELIAELEQQARLSKIADEEKRQKEKEEKEMAEKLARELRKKEMNALKGEIDDILSMLPKSDKTGKKDGSKSNSVKFSDKEKSSKD